jgi:hypothetical protein
MSVAGSCLCGDVAFEIAGPIEGMGFCHCSMCRKHHGTASAAFAFTPRAALRWLRGADRVRGHASSPVWRRTFCGRCGSKTPDPASREPLATVFVGLLEGDPGARPSFHMMVGSKAPWYTISDSLPRHDGFPPGSGEEIAWPRATEPKSGSIRGACLCGAIAYEVDAPFPLPIVLCHCRRCRKARGSAHAANVFTRAERFRWLGGEASVREFKPPDAERFAQAFCTICGSAVPRVGQSAVVPAGTLEDDPIVRPGLHIFTGSKAEWFSISDSLPQYPEYPPPAAV